MNNHLSTDRPEKIITVPSLSWAFFDFADTIFSMNVVSLYFALWVVEDLGGTDLMVALARSAAMLLIAVSMPFMGALSDKIGRRKIFIFLFTSLCCLFTASLKLNSGLISYLIFFGAAVFCYQASLVFYNALLPQISPPGREGKVSGLGVALGYVGSIVGMLMIRPFVGTGSDFSRQASFLPTAILFFFFSLPMFLFVREKIRPINTKLPPFWELFKSPYRIFKTSSEFPIVKRFLIARFFIVEAMETIIAFMSIYLVMVGGFNQKRITATTGMDEVMLFLISATVFAVIGSFVWGVVADRIGPGRSLKLCTLLWVITLLLAIVSAVRPMFWVIGPLAGIGLGGIWTTDRPYLLQLAPKERSAEFFGLCALSGRLAAVIGPLLWGLIVLLAGPLGVVKYRLAVASVFVMMLIGWLLIRRLPEEN
ncbi:MAG: MFS transporter [candidate division Zixibacteria bacterium CG_4_9_14_3_um_filter_46_8]|nr:MAG: MFS transporter [candidate division Zixibacteria bacterium CG_4_9_14_3_um_filter_46_8]